MFDRRPSVANQFSDDEDVCRGGTYEPRSALGSSMSDTHSVAIEPFSEEELRDLRKVGRERRSFDDLAKEIMRLQLISVVMPPFEDPEASRGVRRRERTLLLEMFAMGSTGPDELRLGALLSRCAPHGDNLVAMLSAALEFDCMRLGLVANGGSADLPYAQ